MCKCPLEARLDPVKKEGDNQGRLFWHCPSRMPDGCGFFEWDDEPPRAGGSSSNANGVSTTGADGGGTVCYRVGESGFVQSLY